VFAAQEALKRRIILPAWRVDELDLNLTSLAVICNVKATLDQTVVRCRKLALYIIVRRLVLDPYRSSHCVSTEQICD
jgi:hypothetical protein